MRRLIYRQSAEKAQDDNFRLQPVERRELFKRVVESNQIDLAMRRAGKTHRVVERDLQTEIAFFRVLFASVINKDSPHHLCCDRKKMRAILPRDFFPFDKTNICLMNECGGLKRVVASLVFHVALRKLSQFGVDKRKKFLRRLAVAAIESLKQNCNLSLVSHFVVIRQANFLMMIRPVKKNFIIPEPLFRKFTPWGAKTKNESETQRQI